MEKIQDALDQETKQKLIQDLNEAIQDAIAVEKGWMSKDDEIIIESKTFRFGIEFGKRYIAFTKTLAGLNNEEDPGAIEAKYLDEFDGQNRSWVEDIFCARRAGFINDMRIEDPYILATFIADHIGVGAEFHEYIACAITGEKLPTKIGDGRIQVIDILDDSQVILSIDRGIKPISYKAAWNGLSKYITKDVFITNETTGNTIHGDLERRIIEAWRTGYTYSQIAKEFFPQENYIIVKDRIAKLIQRSGAKKYKVLRNKK